MSGRMSSTDAPVVPIRLQIDPAADHEQRSQQHDERHVLQDLLVEDLPALRPPHDEQIGGHRNGEQRRHDGLVAIVLPPVRGNEREDRDGEQDQSEGENGDERKVGAERSGHVSLLGGRHAAKRCDDHDATPDYHRHGACRMDLERR
jgi:hypothetical protein